MILIFMTFLDGERNFVSGIFLILVYVQVKINTP